MRKKGEKKLFLKNKELYIKKKKKKRKKKKHSKTKKNIKKLSSISEILPQERNSPQKFITITDLICYEDIFFWKVVYNFW